MSVFVVDASLVIKWFVPEAYSEAARLWLDAPPDYVAPDLLFPETGNTVWKKVRRGELSPDEGQQLVTDLSMIAVEAVSMRGLLKPGLTADRIRFPIRRCGSASRPHFECRVVRTPAHPRSPNSRYLLRRMR